MGLQLCSGPEILQLKGFLILRCFCPAFGLVLFGDLGLSQFLPSLPPMLLPAVDLCSPSENMEG